MPLLFKRNLCLRANKQTYSRQFLISAPESFKVYFYQGKCTEENGAQQINIEDRNGSCTLNSLSECDVVTFKCRLSKRQSFKVI